MSLPGPEILEVHLVPHEELKAFVTVGIGPIELKGFRVLATPEMRVEPPLFRTIKRKRGLAVRIHDEELLDEIRYLALTAYHQKLATKQALAHEELSGAQ